MTASMDRIFVVGQDSVPELTVLDTPESLRWTIVVPPGQDCRLAINLELNCPECDVDIAALYLCQDHERVSIDINMRHNAPSCRSRQQIRGIVGGEARASFNGLIYVRKDSQQTKAYQECHSILLSDKAIAEARPQLEIYADDVECSHGATSGYLDREQAFYMQSRGIDAEQVKALQLQAFLAPVLSRLTEEMKANFIAQI